MWLYSRASAFRTFQMLLSPHLKIVEKQVCMNAESSQLHQYTLWKHLYLNRIHKVTWTHEKMSFLEAACKRTDEDPRAHFTIGLSELILLQQIASALYNDQSYISTLFNSHLCIIFVEEQEFPSASSHHPYSPCARPTQLVELHLSSFNRLKHLFFSLSILLYIPLTSADYRCLSSRFFCLPLIQCTS